ncbi:hypothetical protein HAPS_0855 [Glaesserella parasuis SH0165]|uniref:Uncharacterized protein n=1 Tax=Glaesserella parasuis serovar 5 (strain SH0165) TaxID=557723 RepID=B8F584_GLAP5|nr:hypothetical protein HAPS_0855 [Glaesserella parasuis SH0165]
MYFSSLLLKEDLLSTIIDKNKAEFCLLQNSAFIYFLK